MTNERETIPDFASEAEERAYWETHDSMGRIDWSGAQRTRFPNLKPSTNSISRGSTSKPTGGTYPTSR